MGVILCKCGSNIADAIDLGRLKDMLISSRKVAWVEIDHLPCSAEGAQKAMDLLKARPVDALVVAGCSPKERERIFADAMGRNGFDPAMFQMANIREHCAWVVPDKRECLDRAAVIVRAAIERVLLHETIPVHHVKVEPSLLVIGAGVAGMEAALTAARAGRQVHLVEKSGSIGGRIPSWDELFPCLECSSCAVEPLADEVLHHPRIHLHLRSEIQTVRGFLGQYRINLRTIPRGVRTEACIGCGACLDPCPALAPDPSLLGWVERHAMHNEYVGALPNAPLIDWDVCRRAKGEDCRACEKACGFGAVDLAERPCETEIIVGGVVLAVGMGDASTGDLTGVVTYQQFERLLNPNGPTSGKLEDPQGTPVKRLAMIAGASGLMSSITDKYIRIILHRYPDVTIDLLVPEGSARPMSQERLTIHAHDPKKMPAIQFDLMVAGGPIPAAPGTRELAAMFGIDVSPDGFFLSERPLLQPVSSRVRGVQIAGCCAGLKDIPTSMTQGAAAVGRLLSLLPEGEELEMDPRVSVVDPDRCCGCTTCLRVCPFGAITRNESAHAVIEEVLCRGCGICSAACPSGAIFTRHFTSDQIGAEVAASLNTGRAAS